MSLTKYSVLVDNPVGKVPDEVNVTALPSTNPCAVSVSNKPGDPSDAVKVAPVTVDVLTIVVLCSCVAPNLSILGLVAVVFANPELSKAVTISVYVPSVATVVLETTCSTFQVDTA